MSETDNKPKEDKRKRLLVSGTSDKIVRFWCLQDLPKKPLFALDTQHGEGESLTAFAVTEDAKFMVTGDTSGNLKCWDVSKVDFWADTSNDKKRDQVWDIWFIEGHKKIINSI